MLTAAFLIRLKALVSLRELKLQLRKWNQSLENLLSLIHPLSMTKTLRRRIRDSSSISKREVYSSRNTTEA